MSAAVVHAAAAAVLAAGCTDDRAPVGASAPASVRTSLSAAAGAISEGFDAADTYAQYEVETVRQYTTTGRGAGAGRARVADSKITRPTERTRIEVGYDAQGRRRLVMTPLVDPASDGVPVAQRVARVIVVDGETAVYAADGTRLDTRFRQGLSARPAQVPSPTTPGGPSASLLDAVRATPALVAQAAKAGAARTRVGDSRTVRRLSDTAIVLAQAVATGGAVGTVEQEFRRAADGSYQLARTRTVSRRAYKDFDVEVTEAADVRILALREAPERELRRRGGAGQDAAAPAGDAPAAVCPVSVPGDASPASCYPPPDEPPPDEPPPPPPPTAPVTFTGRPCGGFQFCPPSPITPGIPVCVGFGGFYWCRPPLWPVPNAPPPPPPGAGLPAVGLVFEHGFWDDDSRWGFMSRDLKAAFPATEMRAHQRDWRASIGDQAAGVVQAMQGEPELFYIYIGHSLGGLVARDVYHRMAAERQAGRRGTPPFGVIAIGTPHVGAPIAARVPQLSSVVLNALATVSGVTCGAVAAYGTGAAGLCLASARVGEFVEQQLVPVAAAASRTDMVPRSQYLNARNARPDAFTRAAIRSHAPPRWIMWRVAGDALGTCPPEAEFCNGDALAGAANVGYSSLRGLAYFFATHYMHYLALEARGAADQMDYMDMQWSIMTTQGDPNTDGIVPGASQEYPGQGLHTGPGSALRQVVIASGPSHVQEPRSRAVIAATADLLETHFRIRTFPRP